MNTNRQYLIANLLFVLTFLVIIIVVLFFNQHIVCPYKAEGLSCPTCGLTRTFWVVLGKDSDFSPSSRQINLVYFFLGQLLLRLVLVVVQIKWQFSRKWMFADAGISAGWFLIVIVPFYL